MPRCHADESPHRQRTEDRPGGWRAPVLLSSRRHTPLQPAEPVIDDHHAGRRGVWIGRPVFEHQEASAIRRDVVVASRIRLRIHGVENRRRRARHESRTRGLDSHANERARFIEVEELEAVPSLHGACPSSRRDLPALAIHLRKRPHVDLLAARFARLVRKISTIGRDSGPTSVEADRGD
jgi:hypothetical protein